MKVQIEGPGSVKLETKQDTLEIDTNGTNAVTLVTDRGKFKVYERNGEIELAHEGRVVFSSYDRSGDSWKEWGPPPPPTQKSK